MTFKVKSAALQNIEADLLVCAINEQGELLASLGEEADAYIAKQSEQGNLPSNNGDYTVFYEVSAVKAARLMVIRVGGHKGLEKAAEKAAEYAVSREWQNVVVALTQDLAEQTIVARKLACSSYRFDQFKSDKKKAAKAAKKS